MMRIADTPTVAPMRHTASGEPFLTTEQAAKLLHKSSCTLRRWRSTDQGPPWYKTYLGQRGCTLYLASDIRKWMEGQKVCPGTKLSRLRYRKDELHGITWRHGHVEAVANDGSTIERWTRREWWEESVALAGLECPVGRVSKGDDT